MTIDDPVRVDQPLPSEGRPPAAKPGDQARALASLGYQPSLDGLRGLALLAIVVFHSQVGGVPGAFLSVSTFFTLSGFLITTVVLADHHRAGRTDLRRFYSRRARRLLPAAIVAVLLITVVTAIIGDVTQMARLRPDALTSLFYVGNWRLVAAGDSYGDIFQSPSMFTHFWTLAIEEQFYVLFPLVVGAVLWVFRRSLRALAIVLAAIIVLATAWSTYQLHAGATIDRLYFGTDVRIAEILMGSLLAVWWVQAPPLRPALQRAARIVGMVALLVMLASWHYAERTSELFYQGGFVLYSVLTLLVILGAIQPSGALRTTLGWKPLVFIGTISYGAYLLHWPILVWLQLRSPLPYWAQLIVGLAITVLLAWLLARWVEQPIRRGQRLTRPRAQWVAVPAMVAAALVVLLLTVVVPATDSTAIDFTATGDKLGVAGVGSDALSAERAAAIAKLSPEERAAFDKWSARQSAVDTATSPRVAFFGDSAALMTGFGVADWSADHLDQLAPAKGEVGVGCGLLTDVVRSGGKEDGPPPRACSGWLDRWQAAVTQNHVDVAVVQFGPWEVYDQQLKPDGPVLALGRDPALEQAVTDRLDAAVTLLLQHVKVVVLVRAPNVTFERVGGVDPPRPSDVSDPQRMEAFRSIEQSVLAKHDHVASVDLASFLASSDDARLRPDGVHFTETTSREVAEWLGPEVRKAFDQKSP